MVAKRNIAIKTNMIGNAELNERILYIDDIHRIVITRETDEKAKTKPYILCCKNLFVINSGTWVKSYIHDEVLMLIE